MRPSSSPPGHAAGFTLIELLVALTLFAVLSILLFNGLRFGTRAAGDAAAHQEETSALAAATGFLRNELADAQPLNGEAEGNSGVAFDGEPDSVDFVVLPPAYLAQGGWHALHIGVERQGKNERLVMSWRLVRTVEPSDGVEAPHRSALLDRLGRVEFAYFGRLAENDAPEWHDRWNDATVLPALVRLRMTLADGRPVPDLVVALRCADPLRDLP